jgi:hypothetical protein
MLLIKSSVEGCASPSGFFHSFKNIHCRVRVQRPRTLEPKSIWRHRTFQLERNGPCVRLLRALNGLISPGISSIQACIKLLSPNRELIAGRRPLGRLAFKRLK